MSYFEQLSMRQKRVVAAVCAAGLFVIAIATLVDDIFARRWDEVALNGGLFVLAVTILVWIRYRPLTERFYGLVVGALVLDLIYVVAKGVGDGAALFWMYFVPPMTMYFLGYRKGLAVTAVIFVVTAMILFGVFGDLFYRYNLDMSLRFCLSFMFVAAITAALERAQENYSAQLVDRSAELEREKLLLENAMHEITILGGLLPICARCKRIRDDDDEWQEIEDYIATRSQADFTHSICPDCTDVLYPELELRKVSNLDT